ncbi:hypothetical protein EMIHUDRAFT_252297 [Emiliania huxleyi CCMP1516]|uniref:Pseudouridine synthase I TruA alpha/beta domain-containing protein n=2 Tax=Emiliania huxleyi TaxID=2903 RepID=A0A0D3KMI1_EMIH1|nr:hypothetical protein EMIHUDRAFT_252297 [Emiliania huxleyi CCMP1516]EOD36966.1 hypothetical protein EMIHUDRAFT_252297 [Emiliania huxleyi CCMP1516]|eukprot:XP_005789395.1 hypothetical protein EMIHUDRAFT_252297 [Emiliania huxleyi CCMP1516]
MLLHYGMDPGCGERLAQPLRTSPPAARASLPPRLLATARLCAVQDDGELLLPGAGGDAPLSADNEARALALNPRGSRVRVASSDITHGHMWAGDAKRRHMDMKLDTCSRALLEGRRDFASFQSKGGRSTTVRTLHRCDVRWCEGEGLAITLEGDGFLYNMARIVAGTLLQAAANNPSSSQRHTAQPPPLAPSCRHSGLDSAQVGVGCRSASSVEQYERPWASRGEAAGQDDVVVDEAS